MSRVEGYCASSRAPLHSPLTAIPQYHHYRHGRYPLPNDDLEQGRDAMKHAIHLEACNGELINAPIGSNPQRILDLATGTGLWAMDGETFQSLEDRV